MIKKKIIIILSLSFCLFGIIFASKFLYRKYKQEKRNEFEKVAFEEYKKNKTNKQITIKEQFKKAENKISIKEKDNLLKGVWICDGKDKMQKYLGVYEKKHIPTGYFCMQYFPNENIAKFRFLFDENEYSAEVNKISETRYEFKIGSKIRNATIHIDYNELSNLNTFYGAFLYFDDSNPWDPLKHKYYTIRDCSTSQNEQARNLQECYADMKKTWEHSQMMENIK